MVNFGPLSAEIGPVVWGTPVNLNGFRVLPSLLYGTLVVGVSQTLRRWTEGATYIRLGGHHVGHWPTFLVAITACSSQVLPALRTQRYHIFGLRNYPPLRRVIFRMPATAVSPPSLPLLSILQSPHPSLPCLAGCSFHRWYIRALGHHSERSSHHAETYTVLMLLLLLLRRSLCHRMRPMQPTTDARVGRIMVENNWFDLISTPQAGTGIRIVRGDIRQRALYMTVVLQCILLNLFAMCSENQVRQRHRCLRP